MKTALLSLGFILGFLAPSHAATARYVQGKIVVTTADNTTAYMTLSASGINITTPTIVLGAVTNSADTPGAYGESVATVTTANIVAGTSAQYSNVLSTTVGAGIWDFSAMACANGNAATWSDVRYAISTSSANTTTDHVSGLNVTQDTSSTAFGASDRFTITIPRYRISLATPTTVYFKANFTYTVGTPSTRFCSMTATRVR